MANSVTDPQAALVSEQLSHIIDLLKAENKFLAHRVEQLEELTKDHETRLRANTDGVTQFKVWSALTSAVAVAALVRAFLGR